MPELIERAKNADVQALVLIFVGAAVALFCHNTNAYSIGSAIMSVGFGVYRTQHNGGAS